MTNSPKFYLDLEERLLDHPESINYPFRTPTIHVTGFWLRNEIHGRLRESGLRFIAIENNNFVLGVRNQEDAWMAVNLISLIDVREASLQTDKTVQAIKRMHVKNVLRKLFSQQPLSHPLDGLTRVQIYQTHLSF